MDGWLCCIGDWHAACPPLETDLRASLHCCRPQVKVTLIDQSTYTARVLGFDPDKDVAVLKVGAFWLGRPTGHGSAQDERVLLHGTPHRTAHTARL